MRVSAEGPDELGLASSPPRFRTIKNAKDDLKGLYAVPAELWDRHYVGEALTETDECHPENSSFIIGAAGGIVTGLATGFFSTSRVPTPINTPIPSTLFPRLHSLLSNSVIFSSTGWRVAKRTALGSLIYAVLECDFKDLIIKEEEKYKGSIASAGVCGAIFGLRGGLKGIGLGMTLFSTVSAAFEVYKRRDLM